MKLFSFFDACPSPQLIGFCECVEDNTYAKLIALLEGIHIVDRPFQFYDIESRCKIDYKLEGLIRLFPEEYDLLVVDPNLESKKCMHVIDLDFIYDSQQTLECIEKEVEIQELTPLNDFDHPLPPPIGSRFSGESIDHLASNMKSTLVSYEVTAKYLLAKEKT